MNKLLEDSTICIYFRTYNMLFFTYSCILTHLITKSYNICLSIFCLPVLHLLFTSKSYICIYLNPPIFIDAERESVCVSFPLGLTLMQVYGRARPPSVPPPQLLLVLFCPWPFIFKFCASVGASAFFFCPADHLIVY